MKTLEDKPGKKTILFVPQWDVRKIKIGPPPFLVLSVECEQWGEEKVLVRTARGSESAPVTDKVSVKLEDRHKCQQAHKR